MVLQDNGNTDLPCRASSCTAQAKPGKLKYASKIHCQLLLSGSEKWTGLVIQELNCKKQLVEAILAGGAACTTFPVRQQPTVAASQLQFPALANIICSQLKSLRGSCLTLFVPQAKWFARNQAGAVPAELQRLVPWVQLSLSESEDTDPE